MSGWVEVVIRQPGFPDRVVPVREGRTHLGRGDDNEIVLSDVGVSRRHAMIVLDRGELSIEDLGSGNGTYYFGHKVKAQPLRHLDEVVIDPFVLQFRIASDPDTVPAGPDTVIQDSDGGRLEVIVGPGLEGAVYPIAAHGLTMGRAEDRDIVIPDPASSRHHCHITLEGSEYVLHDNGSANGVFVNAVRVRECTLSDGDLVRIGNTEMRFVNPSAAPVAHHEPEPQHWEPEPPPEPSWHDPSDVDEVSEPLSSERPAVPRAAPISHQPDAGGGPFGMIAAAIGGVAVVAVVAATALLASIALLLWLNSGKATLATLPERPPGWELKLPTDLPRSDTDTLFAQASAAAQGGDYIQALENCYRVLTSKPGHVKAKIFAAFTAEVMVSKALERDLVMVEKTRVTTENRRDRLLRQYRDSKNNRTRIAAKSDLQKDFRDDPLVQEEMGWGLTPAQLDMRDSADRAQKFLQQDQHAEALRQARRVLDGSKEPALRDRALAVSLQIERAQAQSHAELWRRAVLADANDDVETAAALYKDILKNAPNNASARLRLERLESGRRRP